LPNRILRDGILRSKRVAALSPAAEVFYRRLMSVADDFGRYYAELPVLLSDCFPFRPLWADEESLSLWLRECEAQNLVFTYEVSGTRFLEIWNFGQRVRGTKSKFPPHIADERGALPPTAARASSPSPTTTTHTAPTAAAEIRAPLEPVLDELAAIYLEAGRPVAPKQRQLCAQYFSEIPADKWPQVAAFVRHALATIWRDPTKTKSLVNLLRDGDWDVPIVERSIPPPVNGTRPKSALDVLNEMQAEERSRHG
jgi:hypothetical protein